MTGPARKDHLRSGVVGAQRWAAAGAGGLCFFFECGLLLLLLLLLT
jgi:hypothetical protein